MERAMTTTTTRDKLRIILVPHTHWDREWYVPYQRYRTRLVGFFDMLLDILDNDPDYKHFMLDGHAILVEDYLEVRPDRREKLERYVRAGRLAAGPWYVIPDEFLPSGEALVRNILRGHRVARELGVVMNVGYIPDPFGQIAHMPAIFKGFGIERAVFWRGTDTSLTTTELIWESPDGSSVLTKHIRGGYGIGAPFPTEEQRFIERVEEVRALLQPLASVPELLLMWGSDHTPPQRELSRLVRAYNEQIADAELVIGSLPQLFDELEPLVGGPPGQNAPVSNSKVVKRRGEFRSGQLANVLPGVLSARMWIKQRTFDCEQLLTRWAEPLTLWSELLRARLGEVWLEPPLPPGPASPPPSEVLSESGLLDRAWRLLLENQPHDSICGCSADQTHDEMRPRFDQCEQIAEDLTQQSMRRIGAQGLADRVFVFNPLPGPRTDYVTSTVPAVREATPVALIDDRGKRHECQLVEADPTELVGRPRTTIGFVARDVPGFGYRTYKVEYGQATRALSLPALSRVEGSKGNSKTRAPSIDNGIFVVGVDPKDGSLRVEIKGAGVRYKGLNHLVDGGDRGDEYNYCATDPDPLVDAPAGPPKVRLIEDGPARKTLEITMTYRLPARLNGKRKRVAKTVACPVRVLVSLSPGVPRIDIRTEFENNAEDHRLRAYFPSGVQTGVAHAEQHFGVVTRTIALPQADDTWCETPSGYQPQKTFVDVNDGHGGLMIANRGLPEYEALPGKAGVTIALTLLRCVGWLSRMDYPVRKGHAGPPFSTPGAQMIGKHAFEYSIIPHAGGWEKAYAEAHQFATPMRARFNRQGTGQLPASASLLDLDGAGLVVTAIKRAEDGDGAVVRAYNTLNRASSGTLSFGERWSRAELVDMKEDALDSKADVANKALHLKLRPNEIVTVRFS
jgi:mannosylglycerate hydrolase